MDPEAVLADGDAPAVQHGLALTVLRDRDRAGYQAFLDSRRLTRAQASTLMDLARPLLVSAPADPPVPDPPVSVFFTAPGSPAGPPGPGLGSAQAWVLPAALVPSLGAGFDDETAIAWALSASPVTGLLTGTYNVYNTVAVGLGQWLRGNGRNQTVVALASSAGAVPAVKVSASSASVTQFAALTDLTVDITGSASGSTGVQAGNVLQLRLLDVFVHGASGAGSTGLHFLNDNSHTEQAVVRAYLAGLDDPVVFDVTGTDPSFDRGEFDFCIDQYNANGNGVAWKNGALQVGGTVRVRGNFAGGASNTGVVLALSGTGAVLQDVNLDVSVECDGSGTGPQTVNFGGGSNTISGYGSVQFLNSGGTFQASNNNGQWSLNGTVAGDASLQTLINAGQYHTVSSGFPTGVSGTVKFQKLNVQDLVYVDVNLSVASGTVIGSPETLLSGLGSPYVPVDSKFMAFVQEVNGVKTAVTLEVTSGGVLLYQGAGFTASGTSNILGTATYSNSQ